MATSHGTGITWRELHTALTTTFGCTETGQQVGSHIGIRAPHGADVPACDPNKPGYVSKNHLREVARVFGLNITDFEVRMGRKPEGKSKLTRKRSQGNHPIPAPFQQRAVKAANTIERSAIRIAHDGRWHNCIHVGAIKELERIAKELAALEGAAK